jgi:hypothetical protein
MKMMMIIRIALLAMLLSGCAGLDHYRPEQKLSIRLNGEQSHSYTLYLSDSGERVKFHQTNGVHTVTLPGVSYGTRFEFCLPVTSYPEQRELVIFSRNGIDIDGMSVQNMRNYVTRTADGVYQVRLR